MAAVPEGAPLALQIYRLLSRGLMIMALTGSFAVSTAVFNATYANQSRVDAQLTNGADVTDDGVSLTIATRDPATVLSYLAERQALNGLQVRGATLEDVFLNLTGREYRA